MNIVPETGFFPFSQTFNTVFKPGRLSIGLVAPLEAYLTDELPTLERHMERVQLAEELGFPAIWLRDIPFNVPSFGDVGQMLDPYVYLGALAMGTERIGLGIASTILPLRHPAHVAKAAASADVLSGGRVLLGIASGDRPEEYPAMNVDFETRGAAFRESVNYMRATFEEKPHFEGHFGRLNGHLDMLPKPMSGRVPMFMTGLCQQTLEWCAEHGDGWITYPRNADVQERMVDGYREAVRATTGGNKPILQSLYVDILKDPSMPARPIHLGFQSGTPHLIQYLRDIESIGVNHVILNLRFNNGDIEDTIRLLSDEVISVFS